MSGGHGTYAGYNQHIATGTAVCGACRDAASAYARRWRFLTGRQRTPHHCKDCGSHFGEHRCHMEEQR